MSKRTHSIANSAAKKLWQPSKERMAQSNLAGFASWLAGEKKIFADSPSWQELYEWSIADAEAFWPRLAEFLQTKFQVAPLADAPVFVPEDPRKHLLGSWFPGAKLNYAENLLEHPERTDNQLFCICVNDAGDRAEYTRAEIKSMVCSLQVWLKDRGVAKGDRVCAVVYNGIEALAGFLACASIGAVWSSCSPDFGIEAVVDRFAALEPKLLIANLHVQYAGKIFDKTPDIKSIASQISSVENVLLSTPKRFLEESWEFSGRGVELTNWQVVAAGKSSQGDTCQAEPFYESLGFDDPLYVLFSSGTTGKPKCIVHAVGRVLLQHQKELALHTDLKPGDRMLFFTTCGWMMWNWLVSTPSVGAVPVLFDGSPAYPDLSRFWQVVENTQVDVLGTSPKYIRGLMQKEFSPAFSPAPYAKNLKTLLSTGAPLLPEQFEWVYQNVQSDLHLASISGGTDIVSCFMLGNPLLPVNAGELQSPGLGMAVEVWDSGGKPVLPEQAKGQGAQEGELVCTGSFISMPVSFWGDPKREKITASYFCVYPGVWHHGDYLSKNPETGGFVMGGRSDATLNPGGVRIGTAELYRALEAIAEISDCVAVSDPRSKDAEILLFVVTSFQSNKVELMKELTDRIRKHIRQSLSPRHMPAKVIAVSKIPYTRSGKKVEVAVIKILAGKEIKSRSALVDPTALDDFEAFAAGSSCAAGAGCAKVGE